jgi:hypothetical protein
MKLLNADQAIVAEAKIVLYLLNLAHSRGKDKAAFFSRFGYSVAQWQELAQSLLDHSQTHDIAGVLETPEGTHYAIDGVLSTPDGRNPEIRSVWAVDTGSQTLRFITAYPLK